MIMSLQYWRISLIVCCCLCLARCRFVVVPMDGLDPVQRNFFREEHEREMKQRMMEEQQAQAAAMNAARELEQQQQQAQAAARQWEEQYAARELEEQLAHAAALQAYQWEEQQAQANAFNAAHALEKQQAHAAALQAAYEWEEQQAATDAAYEYDFKDDEGRFRAGPSPILFPGIQGLFETAQPEVEKPAEQLSPWKNRSPTTSLGPFGAALPTKKNESRRATDVPSAEAWRRFRAMDAERSASSGVFTDGKSFNDEENDTNLIANVINKYLKLNRHELTVTNGTCAVFFRKKVSSFLNN